MILDIPQNERKMTAQLEELLNVLPVNHPKRHYIEIELRKILSGESGERGVKYHLKFWYENSKDVVVANNLQLNFNGRSAQIDHLIAMPSCFLVLESKNLPNQIEISEQGDWFQAKLKNGRKERAGIYNPVEQNMRHIVVLTEIAHSLNITPAPRFVSVIVLTRPEIVIEGFKQNKSYYLLRLDKLREFIDKGRTFKAREGTVPATELINKLVKYHSPAVVDVYDSYHIDPKELTPVAQRIMFDIEKEQYLCAFCSTKMIL